jgi:hypothetical protein
MADRIRNGVLALAGLAALAMPGLSSARDADLPATAFDSFLSNARLLLQDSTVRLESLLQQRFYKISPDKPDWFREQTRLDFDGGDISADEALQLVVQQDRRDGTDLLTLRYPIVERGGFNTYVGAGLNQAEYFAGTEGDGAPAVISRRARHRSMGGAAELGADLRLSEQVHVNADVRWVELASDASLLRASDGLVSADPVSVGISLGWRFR